jgi:hypothetical protein
MVDVAPRKTDEYEGCDVSVMQWYERQRAVMSPVALEEQGYFSFYLWTNEADILRAVAELPYVLRINYYGPGITTDCRLWHAKVRVVVENPYVWEQITAVLDERILGTVWGPVISEVLEGETQE